MRLLHKISAGALDVTLTSGLTYGSQGVFSSDPAISAVNALLDAIRPQWLIQRRVSREACLYFYLTADGKVHDIADGQWYDCARWLQDQTDPILSVEIEDDDAYISDLDAYDTVVAAYLERAADSRLAKLAEAYWAQIIPLHGLTVRHGASPIRKTGSSSQNLQIPSTELKRCEVLLAADVPAHALSLADR